MKQLASPPFAGDDEALELFAELFNFGQLVIDDDTFQLYDYEQWANIYGRILKAFECQYPNCDTELYVMVNGQGLKKYYESRDHSHSLRVDTAKLAVFIQEQFIDQIEVGDDKATMMEIIERFKQKPVLKEINEQHIMKSLSLIKAGKIQN